MRIVREDQRSFALGINDTVSPDAYRPQETQKALNFRPTLQGSSLKPRGGSWSPNASNAPNVGNLAVLGGTEWELDSGAKQVVVVDEDNDLSYSNDGGGSWTKHATNLAGLTADNDSRISFAVVREGSTNVLCMAGGGTACWQWDGSGTPATISNIGSGTKYLEAFNDRLVGAGHSGAEVAASDVRDIDNGYGATDGGWTVQATTADGDEQITGLFQLGSLLLVFKRESVGYVEGFGYETLQVGDGARGISRSVGCIAHRSIAPLGDAGVMWLSERGFEAYYLGSPGIRLVTSGRLQGFVDAINMETIVKTGFNAPSAIWLPREQEYWCAVPMGIVNVQPGFVKVMNNRVFVYRPPVPELRPDAMWVFGWRDDGDRFGDEARFTVSDSDDTFPGCLLAQTDGSGQEVRVDERGLLRLVGAREWGLPVSLDGPTLDSVGNGFAVQTNNHFDVSAGSPRGEFMISSLVKLDHDGQLSRPACATATGWFFYLDDDQVDGDGETEESGFGDTFITPVRARVRLRPFLHGDDMTRKKAKRVSVLTRQPRSASLDILVEVDGVRNTERTVTLTAPPRGTFTESRIRTGKKGRQIDVELTVEGNVQVEIVSARSEAQLLLDQI